MARNPYELKGQRFGTLRVTARATKPGETGTTTQWKCRCDCGNEIIRSATSLVGGKALSCTCGRLHGLASRRSKGRWCYIVMQDANGITRTVPVEWSRAVDVLRAAGVDAC